MVPCRMGSLALHAVCFFAFAFPGFMVFSTAAACFLRSADTCRVAVSLAIEALLDLALRHVPLCSMALLANVDSLVDVCICFGWVFSEYDNGLRFCVGVTGPFPKGYHPFDVNLVVEFTNPFDYFLRSLCAKIDVQLRGAMNYHAILWLDYFGASEYLFPVHSTHLLCGLLSLTSDSESLGG